MGVGIDRSLEINITFGSLDLQSTPMESELDMSRRDFQLDKEDRQFSLTTNFPQVQVDSTEVYEDLNRKKVVSLASERADKGMQEAYEAIGRISAWGDQLQRIEDGGNPLIDQVIQHVFAEDEFNIALVPQNPPRIEVQEGEIDLDYSPEELRINLEDIARRAYIEAGSLNIQVDPEPQIDIRVR
ncbi:DUF6470 family protein [Natranaerofaba carboxydovora]|uniref:DUF6470 family protein n=1 Tax=Natranaerofaba carboxydovora TaxID=2742683 RepID=UPI001F12A6CD|nr:DUF6470 family protein [Natranaerofaba carboxydovora]UMZ74994.1 hypothetical protein ACONDI_02600 [Natranaerofaba carboxydovora]